MTTIGSLFSGYGGLDMGVQLALGTMRTAWVSDIEPGPNKILAERFPDAPNLGDITTIDWDQVEPVDIITGGSPCQDLSLAGARAGMKPGTRSGLWESMTHAIEQLQPRLVVWENVRGALSAEAYSDSNMGFFEGLVDERAAAQRPTKEKGQPLRALGRVLGDLANLGYDARWTSVRAADVGAPHQRERVFVVAYPSGERLERYWPQRTQEEHAVIGSGQALLPTPTVGDKGGPAARGGQGFGATGNLADSSGNTDNSWGDYAPAIRRWEHILGREAPAPTTLSARGKQHLSPAFVEWMMGLPQGWVTDIDISRATQLRALGNGVVPQQAAYALTEIIN